MHKHMLPKLNQRFANAHSDFLDLRKIGIHSAGFEKIWYSFLLNFNGFFTVLEQASKSDKGSVSWHQGIKEFRKSDPILSYLQHARNMEEHHGISSVTRTKFVMKPKGKRAKVLYRDDKGNRSEDTTIQLTVGEEFSAEAIFPKVKFRNVIDRGIVYNFPTEYTHPVVKQFLGSETVNLNPTGLRFLVIALSHADKINKEAHNL